MELLSQLTFDENKEATLNYVVSDLKSSSTIYVNLTDNKSLTLSIYAVNTDYGVFLNTDSYEMAEENYYSYLYVNEYISEEEYSNYVNEYSAPAINQDITEVVDADNNSDPEIKKRKKNGYICCWKNWMDWWWI